MRYLTIIATILLCSSTAWGGFGYGRVVGGGVSAGGGGDYTLLVDQTTNNSTISLSTYRAGVQFAVPVEITYVRATWVITGASGTCEMRFDDDDTMTTEYLASTTFSPSSGANVVELSVGSRSSGTYYLAVSCPNGNIARSDTDVSASIGYRFVDYVANTGSWGVSVSSTRDWTIKLEYK